MLDDDMAGGRPDAREGVPMPIVSINLSHAAFQEYHNLPKGTRSRRVSYLLMRNATGAFTGPMDAEAMKTCPRCRGVISPPVREGARRIMSGGEECIWTVEGWEVIE